jgi:hypothetical protein
MRPGKVDSNNSKTHLEFGPEPKWHEPRHAGLKLVALTALVLTGVLVFGLATGLAKEKKPTSRTVSGLVLDEAENGIKGATIELTDVQTGKVVAIYSQEGGQYRFSDLLFSHDYKIKATFKGVTSEIRQASSIDTRPHLVINFTLSGLKH